VTRRVACAGATRLADLGAAFGLPAEAAIRKGMLLNWTQAPNIHVHQPVGANYRRR